MCTCMTPKCVTCYSMDPLGLYNFDRACPEVSKYLNGEAPNILQKCSFGEEHF